MKAPEGDALRAPGWGQETFPCRWLSQGLMQPLAPSLVIHLDCVWTGGLGLQTLVIHRHFCPQAFDQAVTKDTCMAVGFFQQGVANFQLDR